MCVFKYVVIVVDVAGIVIESLSVRRVQQVERLVK